VINTILLLEEENDLVDAMRVCKDCYESSENTIPTLMELQGRNCTVNVTEFRYDGNGDLVERLQLGTFGHEEVKR